MYKVYAKVNENNEVVRIFSTCFEQPQEGDVFVCEGEGENYAHVQALCTLYDDNGRNNYKLIDGELTPILEKLPVVSSASRQDEINAMLMLEIAKLKVGS